MIVTLNKPGVIHLQKMIIVSGANVVKCEDFKEEIKNPIVKHLIESGVISYEDSDLGGKPTPDEQYLSKLKPKEAIELIEQTIEMDILQQWQGAEKRKPVLSAIEKQISKLKEPAKLRGQKDADDESESDDEDDAE